jgi:hypothetical protein
MKYLFILFSLFIIVSCSSNADSEETVIVNPVSFPNELKGEWLVSYYSVPQDELYKQTNNKGYYITINDDNTVSLKDVSGEYKGSLFSYSRYNEFSNYVFSFKTSDNKTIAVNVQPYSNILKDGFEFSTGLQGGVGKTTVLYAKKK